MSPEHSWLTERVLFFIPLLLSLTVHEWAHARAALALGDDTALRLGRVSFNPLVHMDPIGTFVLPMLGVPFGWAKPVPFNPVRMHRSVSQTTGALIVALAGPASNLLLAGACLTLLGLCTGLFLGSVGPGLLFLLRTAVLLNLILAVFNLLPIPPLDGSYLAFAFIPRRYMRFWDEYCRLAPFLLVALIFILPICCGIQLFSWVGEFADSLIRMFAGA